MNVPYSRAWFIEKVALIRDSLESPEEIADLLRAELPEQPVIKAAIAAVEAQTRIGYGPDFAQAAVDQLRTNRELIVAVHAFLGARPA